MVDLRRRRRRMALVVVETSTTQLFEHTSDLVT